MLSALPALAAPVPNVRPSPAIEPPSRVFSNLRFQRGDDPQWAQKSFDDSAWQPLPTRELPSRDGIYWVRWRAAVPDGDLARTRDGLILKIVASYEVYWDGQLIGRNGKVGATPQDEVPGVVDALFQIPRELHGPGEHVIALRMSSFHTGFPGPRYGLLAAWGNFREMLLERSRTAIFSVMAVGAALVVSVVFGLMWLLAGRRLPLLLFSALFLCVALMQALQAWRWLFEYPYSWHHPRLVVITVLSTMMALLLPAFVMHHFELSRRAWTYGLLAVALTVAWLSSPIYNIISLATCGVGFIVALGLAARAAWLRRRGAIFACLGFAWSVGALMVAPRDFLDHAFAISSGPAVVSVLIALVLQLRDERREAQAAVLTAARLETELLKKNLQPHFLLNTLATIQEVIEQEPKTAVALIDALSNEFRILARVSGEKLIPLAQEIELCRAHLHVMSLRKGAQCALRVTGAQDDDVIPPALIHTLIENGLTHLLPRGGRQDFELSVEHRAGALRYVLLARGQRHAELRRETSPREGTGMRYIKARLEESFTGRWSVAAGPVPEGWETIIEMGTAAVPGRRPARERPGTVAVPSQAEIA